MHKKSLIILTMVLVAVMVLTSCKPAVEETEMVVEPTAEEVMPTEEPAQTEEPAAQEVVYDRSETHLCGRLSLGPTLNLEPIPTRLVSQYDRDAGFRL